MLIEGSDNHPEADDKTTRVEPLIVDLLLQGLSVEFEVTGSSMAPMIRSHDVISVAPIDPNRLRFGDVVAWIRGQDHLVVHRIIQLGRHSVETRGDAVGQPDGEVQKGRIVGRVVELSRDGRRSHFGLGPERWVLARLSRRGWLARVFRSMSKVRRVIRNKKNDSQDPSLRGEVRR